MKWKSLLKPIRWVARIVLPIAARSLWQKYKPKNPVLAAAMEEAMNTAIDEILEMGALSAERPQVVPALVTAKLAVRFPGIPRAELLKLSTAYCNDSLKLRKRLKKL